MYNPQEIEKKVLDFWIREKIYGLLKKKNSKGKKFYFLQGPPYTSGKLHVGQAWNNSLKDIILRFKRLCGLNVWDRAGYDMHGLPTENAVMKKLGLKDKQDIARFGVDKFVKECTKFSIETAKQMDKDLLRLAIWLDYSDPYYPVKNEFMEAEWWLIKKAAEQKRLYKGTKILHWCAECETNLAKHELEYETLKEDSIYLKFRVKGKKNEFLLIWTTTPWTIAFNLAVMANPKLDYVRVKTDSEIWILAKDLLKDAKKATAKELEVVETFKGKKLEDLRYEHPFYSDLKEQFDSFKAEALHTVVLSEQYVTTDVGTGLVHCAPGCGPEDYEVGKEYKLGPFNNLDEKGVLKNMGKFSGLVAKKDDDKFVSELDKKGSLVKVVPVQHEYATCWRCRKPVVFRASEQWFLKIEDLIPKMLKFNEKVNWVPPWGKNAFNEWIKNLKDNSITRQRFWGTPVPIWQCTNEQCKEVKVVGSIGELKKLAINGSVPSDLHRPWIDSVKIKCQCGHHMLRTPDIIDVWLDSSTTSWSCLYYPKRKDLFEKLFPADFILEATEQIKLWFSMLLIASTVALKRACYKNVYTHGMILDYMGLKMSKSLGNIISPYEVIDKYGADILRYYMCETAAGEDINFNWESVKIKQRNLTVLWNIHKYILELSRELGNPSAIKKPVLGTAEKYILSRLNSTIETVTHLLNRYRIDESITRIEELFLELSRFYIQGVREIVAEGSEKEKKKVLYAIYNICFKTLQLFSIICPFITEQIYQNFKGTFKLKEKSIFLLGWPSSEKRIINKELEKQMSVAQDIIAAILAKRKEAQIGIRWPLASATVTMPGKIAKLQEIVKRQTNIKELRFKSGKKIGVKLDTRLTPALESEGYARELVRRIQEERKKAGLKKENKIELVIQADGEVTRMLQTQEHMLKKRTNASKLVFAVVGEKLKGYKNCSAQSIKGKNIVINFNRA